MFYVQLLASHLREDKQCYFAHGYFDHMLASF